LYINSKMVAKMYVAVIPLEGFIFSLQCTGLRYVSVERLLFGRKDVILNAKRAVSSWKIVADNVDGSSLVCERASDSNLLTSFPDNLRELSRFAQSRCMHTTRRQHHLTPSVKWTHQTTTHPPGIASPTFTSTPRENLKTGTNQSS